MEDPEHTRYAVVVNHIEVPGVTGILMCQRLSTYSFSSGHPSGKICIDNPG